MPTLGPTELVIVLVIVLVLFGANRVGDIVGGVGRGIREFRRAVKEEEPPRPAAAAGSESCPACGAPRQAQQRFCANCGAALEPRAS